jgi:hypothetical protein
MDVANRSGVHGILAGHTHKQLRYTNPASNSEIFCCGTTTQHEPQSLKGGRDENNLLEGNHFQILTIIANHRDIVRIASRDYRYFGSAGLTEPSLLSWKPIP